MYVCLSVCLFVCLSAFVCACVFISYLYSHTPSRPRLIAAVQVFWDRCVEDAHTMCAVCEECAGGREKEGKGGGGEAASDKQTARLQAWCNILQVSCI